MLGLLQQQTRIVNIDETWVNETNFTRKTWASKDGTGNTMLNAVSPRVSMIAAIDTDGRIWFTLSHSNSDAQMMKLFLHSLTKALNSETPGYETNTYALWDNAKYHQQPEVKALASKLGLKMIFSGPYSYSSAPIETLFSQLKSGCLNKERIPTTKRYV